MRRDPNRKLIVTGWVGLVLFCPLALVTGIILLNRNVIGHGVAQLTLAGLYLFVVAPILFGGTFLT